MEILNEDSPSKLQFSHIGLYVIDLPRMARFYKQALRFTQTDAGDLGAVQRVFLSRDPARTSPVELATGRPAHPGFNVVNLISFRVPDIATLRQVHDRLLAEGASDMHPVTHGNAVSVYCRDPECNRLELFMDTPWYCEQPQRETMDLSQPDEVIVAQVEAIAQTTAPPLLLRHPQLTLTFPLKYTNGSAFESKPRNTFSPMTSIGTANQDSTARR